MAHKLYWPSAVDVYGLIGYVRYFEEINPTINNKILFGRLILIIMNYPGLNLKADSKYTGVHTVIEFDSLFYPWYLSWAGM